MKIIVFSYSFTILLWGNNPNTNSVAMEEQINSSIDTTLLVKNF